ncbi:MAG: hypothetical protein AABZ39_00655 [Spirochaetota bacterium]
MITVTVDAGICGFVSTIRAESDDGQTVRVSIDSKCESVAALGPELAACDAYSIAFAKYGASPVYQAADRHFKHGACPVPATVVKAVEAAANLALPKDVIMNIVKQ